MLHQVKLTKCRNTRQTGPTTGRTAIRHSAACGGPFLWGPLFGQTCGTLLNPPLESVVSWRSVISYDVVDRFQSVCRALRGNPSQCYPSPSAIQDIAQLLSLQPQPLLDRPTDRRLSWFRSFLDGKPNILHKIKRLTSIFGQTAARC